MHEYRLINRRLTVNIAVLLAVIDDAQKQPIIHEKTYDYEYDYGPLLLLLLLSAAESAIMTTRRHQPAEVPIAFRRFTTGCRQNSLVTRLFIAVIANELHQILQTADVYRTINSPVLVDRDLLK